MSEELEADWEQYREVLPPDLTAEEVKRHKCSFLAGRISQLNKLMRALGHRSHRTRNLTPELRRQLAELQREIPQALKAAGLTEVDG